MRIDSVKAAIESFFVVGDVFIEIRKDGPARDIGDTCFDSRPNGRRVKENEMMGSWRRLGAFLGMMLSAHCLLAGNGIEEWPQFRGPERNGISNEAGLLETWPAEGPQLIWRKPIGNGFSGISVSGEKLFTMYSGPDGGKNTEYLAAFDVSTGQELWRTAVGDEFIEEFGNGPRSTPAVDDTRVYALSSNGKLVSAAKDSGAVLWALDLVEQVNGKRPRRGYTTSPLLDGDLLLMEVGGEEGHAFAAIDTATGKVVWTALDGSPGYTSPLAAQIGSVRQFMFVRGDKISGVDRRGVPLWSFDWSAGTIAMPLFVPPDKVFVSAAGDVGGLVVRITKDGNGFKAEEVWRNRLLKNHFNASVALDGYLYGFDNASLKCVSVETGEQQWVHRGYGKGSLILAEGKLFILSDQGVLIQAAASPHGFKEAGRVQALNGKSWTSPTLAAGRIYLRNHEEMVSFDVKKPDVDRPSGL